MALAAPTTILALRHGETRWNVEERFQGHGDSPLTDTGRRQVAALARRLKTMTFDRLVSSDLGRARASAEIIAAATGHALETETRLRERHYGVLEGLGITQIKAEHAAILARFNADDPDYVIPEGESHRMVYQRHIAWVEELLAEHPGRTVAIVIHGGVLDSLFRFAARLPLSQPRCYVTTNASLNIFSHGRFYGTDRWVIQKWGDTGHMADIGHYQGLG